MRKQLLILAVILAARVTHAQTLQHEFAISITVKNPTYSLALGIWNPLSATTLYVDRIEIHAAITDTTPSVHHGITFMLTPPHDCSAATAVSIDGTDSVSAAQISGQPCNQAAYPFTTTVCCNILTPHVGNGKSYMADLEAKPIPVPPGRGFAIFAHEDFQGEGTYTVWYHQ